MNDAQQRRFVWRRVARILPANLIGLAFLMCCREVQGPVFFDWNKLLECGLLLQSWVVGDSHLLNGPAWSMSCLLFFYLIFPVVLPVLSRIPTRLLVPLLVAGWLVSSLGVLGLEQSAGPFDLDEWAQYLHNSPLTRSFEFMSGMAVALLVRRHGLPHVRFAWLTLPAVLAVLVFAPAETVAVNNGLFLPLSICVLLAFANPGTRMAALGQHRVVRAASNASMSIFLLHLSLIELFNAWLLPRLHLGWNVWSVAGLLLAVTLSALFVDRCLCRPVTRWLVRPTFPVVTVPARRFRRHLDRPTEQAQTVTA